MLKGLLNKSAFYEEHLKYQEPPLSRRIQVAQSGATNSSNADWLHLKPS